MRPTLFCALFLALGAITSAVAPLTREELLDQLEELGWWDIPRDDLPLPALMLRDSQEHQNRQKTQGKAEAEICYEDLNLGCFSTIEGPLQYLGLLPKSPEWIGTKFRLYNALQENDTYAEFDFYNMSTALENDFFLGSDRTVFFITHGFNGSPDQSYYANYASDLRRLYPESNIFVMDWEKGAASINYPQDIANGALVGRQGALLISRLVMDYGFNASQDLHMIGHSLGGQIMNYVSNWLLELTGQLPARITATDPADPLFYDQGQLAWSHLDPDDAHFVEVIHTDCGPLITLAVGVPMEIGHLDFYPNGGVMQPGCISWLEEVINMILGIPSNSTSCNHGRSNVLLYDSDPENDCQFTTFPCDGIENFEQVLTSPDITVNCGGNCGQIGYDSKGSGRHCLLTFSPDEGLCGQHYRINIHSSPRANLLGTIGQLTASVFNAAGHISPKFNITGPDALMGPGGWKHKIVLDHFPGVTFQPEGLSLEVGYLASEGLIPGAQEWMIVEITLEDGTNTYSSCEEDLVIPSGGTATAALFLDPTSECTVLGQ